MGCLRNIALEFISSLFLAIPIVLILIVFGDDTPLETYRTVVLVMFIFGITFDALVWTNKEGKRW